ncbi:hypothetical protein P8452_02545 [Trifolium repens]|nr:hypothetical protein P8452_01488 [Trifolium repens]WJX12001.1 hypothetical protein P8452_02545 [Trifolium repens]
MICLTVLSAKDYELVINTTPRDLFNIYGDLENNDMENHFGSQLSKTKGIAHLRSAQMRTRQKRKAREVFPLHLISASVLVEFVAVNNNSWSNGHSHL